MLDWCAPANVGCRQVLIPIGGAKASSGLGAAMLRLLPGKTACGQTRLRQFLYV